MQHMLVDRLVRDGWLYTPRIIEAFREVQRVDFLPESCKLKAELNIPLSIGYRQTISQPLVTAFMMELLDPRGKVLDVGCGSGWTTILLAQLADRVWGLDRITELVTFAKKNSQPYSCSNVEFFLTDNELGYPLAGQVDRILVSATATRKEVLDPLFKQLSPKGILVAPIGGSIWKFESDRATEYPGYVFVPLVLGDS